MTTRTLSVPGVSCGHCKTAIETELARLDGVTASDVDVEAKTVRVDGDAPIEAIIEAIDEAGYDAVAL